MAAPDIASRVKVLWVEPAGTEAGENEPVTPDGVPVSARPTAPVKPSLRPMVTRTVSSSPSVSAIVVDPSVMEIDPLGSIIPPPPSLPSQDVTATTE